MKNPIVIGNRLLVAGILLATASVTGQVSASTEDDTVDGLRIAAASFKGEHPGKTHTAYEKSKGDLRSEVIYVNKRVDMRGRPPHNRHRMHGKQMEKAQFARFEETAVVNKKQRNSIYRGSQGLRPPYKRNW